MDAIAIVIVGHVDHGKSTLIGRLLVDTRSLPRGKLEEIKRISRELGKASELAFLTDQLKEEREGELTIDTTQVFFKTRRRRYVIIDTPGHAEFIKNMLTGASLAQGAVILVDATQGLMEQTRRHAYLLNMLGIKHIIVAVNKMDAVAYARACFDRLSLDIEKLFADIGMARPSIIPLSAKTGENVASRRGALGWFRGLNLTKALDKLPLRTNRRSLPLRLPVQDIYAIGPEKVIVGRIASGNIKVGDEIRIIPSMQRSSVKAIRVFNSSKGKASVGESIGIALKQDARVSRGDIIARSDSLPLAATNYSARIFWLSKSPLAIGSTMRLQCSTQTVECKILRIALKIDPLTLATDAGSKAQIEINEAGVVEIETSHPIVMERFDYVEELGRFTLERDAEILAAGIIA